MLIFIFSLLAKLQLDTIVYLKNLALATTLLTSSFLAIATLSS